MKTKLLIIGSFNSSNQKIYGGIEKSCRVLLQSSLADKFEIIQLDSSQPNIPPAKFFYRIFLSSLRFIKLFKIIALNRPDVSLVFCAAGFSYFEKSVMCSILKLFGCDPFIFPRAGSIISQIEGSYFLSFFARIFAKSFSGFLSQGKSFGEFAERSLKIRHELIHLVPNWTATEELLAIGATRNYSYEKKKKIKLLFIGWLIKNKGIFKLLNAANILRENKVEFELTIVGDGVEKRKAENFVISNNLQDKVKFTGWLNDSKLSLALKENDVFILPSKSEGLPNSMIEAMAAGLAVLVSNVGMISDFVVDGETVLFIEPNESSVIADKILKISKCSGLHLKLGKNGHRLASKVFSANIAIYKLQKLIENHQKKLSNLENK